MTYDELKERATPVPLRVLSEFGNRIVGANGYLMAVCECSSLEVTSISRREADAALLVHCRNNFDEAIELLTNCRPDWDWDSDEEMEKFKANLKSFFAKVKEIKP